MITKEQAVDILQSLLPKDLKRTAREQKHEAITMAIKALRDTVFGGHLQGEWIYGSEDELHCDRCGYIVPEGMEEDAEYWDYCPSCGARMTEEEN